MASTKSFSVSLESDLPIVQQQGLNTNKNTFLGGTVEVVGNATFDANVTVSGTVSMAGAVTVTGAISSTGIVTANSATALSGTGTQGIGFSTVANFGIYWGSGIPTVTAATGSLYINYGGTGVASRLYVNSGTTNWVAVTTVS